MVVRAAHRSRRVALAALALALVAPLGARGDGFGVRIEPTWSHSDTEETTASGTREFSSDALGQRYRLGWDKSLGPELRLTLGATLDDARSWSRDDEGTWSDSRELSTAWNVGSSFGNRVLGGQAGFDRRRQEGFRGAPDRIGDGYRLSLNWSPEGLPPLFLSWNRGERHDTSRTLEDTRSDRVSFSTRYEPTRRSQVVYGANLSQSLDRISGSETRDISQSARLSWSDEFLSRIGVGASYSLGLRRSEALSAGASGATVTPQLPLAGLSAVEDFPSLPGSVTLAQAPALIDNQTTTSAGLVIGYGRSVAGDQRPRDLGFQLSDQQTPVTRIDVWIDATLPTELAAALGWTAWASDDNQTWRSVAITAPVAYDAFTNRFEIRIAETRARYMKLTVRPLPASSSTDPRWAEVAITELQPFVERSVTAGGAGTINTLSGRFASTVSVKLLESWDLRYGSSAFVAHDDDLSEASWSLVNGISASRTLSSTVKANAGVDRSDQSLGSGHQWSHRWQGGLVLDPLPTLGGSLGYAGSQGQSDVGAFVSNAFNGLVRAQLYRGVDLSGNGGFSISTARGVRQRAANANAGLGFAPHRRLTLNGGYGWTWSAGGGAESTRHQLDAGGVYSPFGTLGLSGSISRAFGDQTGTLVSMAVGWSPLSGGALQLSTGYSRTLETTADSVNESFSAGARWHIRSGTFLNVSYGVAGSDTPTSEVTTRSVTASLSIGI